ncbi:NUDIX hydrolase [Clostridium sp. Cult3]|uniref:NUDIX hydrolase n=1 Tax=Clostridium sp. Cult3 TaxID=2079004 RepID=UPI001F34032E|nr:NUDIX hydrolase [Clostridium sp. Cult3]MCF6461745.1 NUDIX hydrolase [Clostridium sp. Cult3]
MIEEVSAGGIVVFGNTLLLLKKFNGDWVLPKGRVEKDEDIRETALREVLEESGVKGEILRYIGMVHYTYKNLKGDETVYKTVHWYLMKTNSMESVPQKKEGFVEATFIHIDKATDLVKYEDERKIINKALAFL